MVEGIAMPLGEVMRWSLIAAWAMQHHSAEVTQLLQDNHYRVNLEKSIAKATEFLTQSRKHLEQLRAEEEALAQTIVFGALASKKIEA